MNGTTDAGGRRDMAVLRLLAQVWCHECERWSLLPTDAFPCPGWLEVHFYCEGCGGSTKVRLDAPPVDTLPPRPRGANKGEAHPGVQR